MSRRDDAVREFQRLGYVRVPRSKQPAIFQRRLDSGRTLEHRVYQDGTITSYIDGREFAHRYQNR